MKQRNDIYKLMIWLMANHEIVILNSKTIEGLQLIFLMMNL